MRLIKPSYQIIEQQPGLIGMYKHIERIGRVCYKSEDKITDDSYVSFINMLKERHHGAMLEHGTVYLQKTVERDNFLHYYSNKYSVIKQEGPKLYITTNYRVIIENGWESDLQYLCEPTEYHEKRYSVLFICDIGVTREGNRHRVNSIAEQSTRYCNFSKEKFNQSITTAVPVWMNEEDVECVLDLKGLESFCDNVRTNETDDWNDVDAWLFANLACEFSYMKLINLGWKAQQARTVLPLDTRTEVVYTTSASNWKHFFELRDANSAHPSMQELAKPLHEEFKTLGYV